MRLTSLHLVNFRNHRNLRLELKEGVTGIIGPNGTGKSSIIEAILFALTGRFYGTTKAELLKLGEDSGYVSLGFVLNDKEGTLTRHLDAPKVLLNYDGTVYKKATEIKDLWDDMLQINADIIERVLIARQGQIPALFSGSQAERERVFQKIFLVPNTEKVRNTIFKNYIKTCPPVTPVEDLEELTRLKQRLVEEVRDLTLEIEELGVYSHSELHQLEDRLKFVNECISQQGKSTMLEQAKTDLLVELDDVNSEISAVDPDLAKTLEQLESERTSIVSSNAQMTMRKNLKEKLKACELFVTEEEFATLQDLALQLEDQVHDLNMRLTENAVEISGITKHLVHFNSLHGEGRCQTCGQTLESIHEIIEGLTADKAKALKINKTLKEEHVTGAQLLNELQQQIAAHKETKKQRAQIEELLAGLPPQYKSEYSLTELDAGIADIKDQLAAKNKLLQDKQTIIARLHSVEMQYARLPIYDKAEDPKVEVSELTEVISLVVDNIRLCQQKTVTLKVTEATLKDVEKRIADSVKNKAKNDKRNKYLETLNEIYDAFHSSVFPRALILDYADTVGEYLNAALSDFNIPYRARLVDDFKINIIDADGRKLPSVSGGQEIQVGVSLHLALRELFSQSFPLLIIDEGTTHLDEENVEAYFDIIKRIKAEDSNKQIIIIDHHPSLSDVVDNTIELKK